MTAKEIAKKWHPDSDFDDCKLHCNFCNEGECLIQSGAIRELQNDIENYAKNKIK